MQDEWTEKLSLLGYDSKWITYGVLTQEMLENQISTFLNEEDNNTEHYRYRTFMAFLASKQALSQIELEHFIELICLDEDRTMAGSVMIDLLSKDFLTTEQYQKVKSIFITHQLSILLTSRFGWLAGIANQMYRLMINRFDQCWIPDLPGNILSGDLSKAQNEKCRMVGILSRFEKKEVSNHDKKKWKVLAVVSGPEPQRSLFETILRNQLIQINESALLVKGLPGDSTITQTNEFLHEVNHLNATQLQAALESAEFVVCRSGYSSVMDLAILGQQNCIMVPTPGQPEQEYLADKLNAERIVFSNVQNEFNLNLAMQSVISRKGFGLPPSQALLYVAIDDLLSSLRHG